MRGFVILSLVLGTAAGPAFADPPAKPEKLLCRTSPIIGSNITERVCKTKAQWDEEKKRSKELLDSIRAVPAPIPPR